MKLYSGPLSMFGAKAQIAALEKGLDVEVEMVPFGLATRYQPRHPDVLRVNPKQQVPVLIDGEVELFDSTQIFEYFEHLKPEPPLWPAEPKARARARLLEMKSDEVFFPNVPKLFPPFRDEEEALRAEARAAIMAYYAQVDANLEGRDYLAGDFSYADIAFFMAQAFAALVAAGAPPELKRLAAWRDRVAARESVRTVAGAMAEWLRSNGLTPPAQMLPVVNA